MKYVPMNSPPTEYKQNEREILSLSIIMAWFRRARIRSWDKKSFRHQQIFATITLHRLDLGSFRPYERKRNGEIFHHFNDKIFCGFLLMLSFICFVSFISRQRTRRKKNIEIYILSSAVIILAGKFKFVLNETAFWPKTQPISTIVLTTFKLCLIWFNKCRAISRKSQQQISKQKLLLHSS